VLYVLPDLPYDYAALEPHYSGAALELHHSAHHAAYVEGLNRTLERLDEAREHEAWDSIVGLEKSLAFHLSGHVMHSLFWKNLRPQPQLKPNGELGGAIAENFGSFEALRSQLAQVTLSVQGSGWGVLAWDPLGRRLLVEQVHDHENNVGLGSIPLLVIDAWEHAYYLQFQNRKPEYLSSLWNVLDWGEAQRRFQRAAEFALL
jgi:superoxide dismutase, Fe-Mn family